MFDALRKQRNSIMHTVDLNLKVEVIPIIRNILLSVDYLLGPRTWVKHRRAFIERDRRSAIDVELNDYRVAREFMTVMDLLNRAELLKYFAFDKKHRAYACLNCCNAHDDAPLDCYTAQLCPNTPSSTNAYCFLCDTSIAVERRRCKNPDCKGNVFDSGMDECMSCKRNYD